MSGAPNVPRRWSGGFAASVTIFVVLLAVSLPAMEGSGRDVAWGAQLARFAGQFLPPDLSVLPQTLRSLWETVQIAVMATAIGIVASLLFGFAAAHRVAPRWCVATTRLLLNGIRTLPSLIWALLAVAIVGPNSLAGVIGLSFYSIGYLGKFFSEAFESLDFDSAAGLRQLGASRFQAFQFGLWPGVRPLVLSYSLWMLEYNIRSASIIGYVGAGGLGLQLLRYQEFGQWDRFATVLLCIFVVVTSLDWLSSRLRRRLNPENRATR